MFVDVIKYIATQSAQVYMKFLLLLLSSIFVQFYL